MYNLKLAIRTLLRNKFYTFLSISGFSMGFAVCLIIGLYIYGETQMDTWMPNSKRIVRLYDIPGDKCGLAWEIGESLKNEIPEVEKTCAIQLSDGKYDIPVKTSAQFAKSQGIINTTADFFDLFPLKLIAANPGGLLSEPNAVVITESLANKLFPGENPLGQKLSFWNYFDVAVSAVVSDFPQNSSLKADIFTSANNLKFRMDQYCDDGKCFNPYSHYVLLKTNADRAFFTDNLNRVIPNKEYFIERLGFQDINRVYLSPSISGNIHQPGNPRLLYVLGSFGILILLLSSFNFLNFYISMQYVKIKEMGIKKINGAGFRELLSYSLTEVCISILFSLIIAFLIFSLLLPIADNLFEQPLNTQWLFTLRFGGLVVLLIAALILINSIIPVYITARYSFGSLLTKAKAVSLKQNGRKVMTFVQFSISIALIVITLSIYHQLDYIKHADLGFNKEHLVRLNFSWVFKNQDALRDKLRQLPEVEKFTLTSGVPGKIHLKLGVVTNNDTTVMFNALYADANFFKAMGIGISEGRDFLQTDNKTVCIINQEAMKHFGVDKLDGRRFNAGREGGYEIIGVCHDFLVNSMYEKIAPTVVMLKDETEDYNRLRYASILLKPGNVGLQMKELEKVWKSFIPDEPMNYEFYDETFHAMYRNEDRLAKSIGIAATIALILTFMGILGQAFQISLNRTKEIGIRKVNGATVAQVLSLLNRGFVLWVLLAFVIATPVAYYLVNKWLESFAYKASISWWTFALGGVIVLLVVMLTVTVQCWKIANKNPVEALRYE